MTKQDLINQLDTVMEQLESQQDDPKKLARQALGLIDQILSESPFEIEYLFLRMRLNLDIFSNIDDIIKDARFIMRNDEFGENKLAGYDWLYWVYNNVKSKPDKALKYLEWQLTEVATIFPKHYQRKKVESEILDKLARHKYDNNQTEDALKLWYKSFQRYPYLIERNAVVGMLFLELDQWQKAEEMLLTHYYFCYDYEDGYRLKYGIELKKLYDKNKLDKYPNLIGLLFHLIRNEEQYFNITNKLDFYKNYLPELEKWGDKYPESSFIWSSIANTYYYDTRNYPKAFECYKKVLKGDLCTRYINLKRIHKSAKKSGNDFLGLPFCFDVRANELYGSLTDTGKFVQKAKNGKQKRNYSSLAIKFGESGYQKYKSYLFDEIGDEYNNQPHIFAMLCNNYANALGDYADITLKDDDEAYASYYSRAGDIHLEGYAISPFYENIRNASSDYFTGKQYKKSIECSEQYLDSYINEMSVDDVQNEYWQITYCFIRLKDLKNAEIYYYKAKDYFLKYGHGNKDAEYKFIFNAKLFYQFAVRDTHEYHKYISEMKWFVHEKIALDQEPLEHGLINYYLGLCYQQSGSKEKAIAAFKSAINELKESDEEFYLNKEKEARTQLKALGVVVKKQSTTIVQVLKKILFFPLGIIVIIGLLFMSMLSDDNKKKK